MYLSVETGRLTELAGKDQRVLHTANIYIYSVVKLEEGVRYIVVCFSQIYHLSETAHNIHDQLLGDYNWADIHTHTVTANTVLFL